MKAVKLVSAMFAVIILSANTLFCVRNLIAHGTEDGSLYMCTTICYIGQTSYQAIFYTNDYGQTLIRKYMRASNQDTMDPGYLFSDPTPGCLYNRGTSSGIWRSMDYGINWTYNHTPYNCEFASGNFPGTVYYLWFNDEEFVTETHKSIDYCNNFPLINTSAEGTLVPGINMLEVYSKRYVWEGPLLIYYSTDDANTNTLQCTLTQDVVGLTPYGLGPTLYSGAVEGEVYLVTWHEGHKYRILRSTDYAQTFTQLYESENVNILEDTFWFQPGTSPGSFYVVQMSSDTEQFAFMDVYISYSGDYAQTFTTIHHHLDETWTDKDDVVSEPSVKSVLEQNYPNPFNPETTIAFSIPADGKVELAIYNIKGQKVRTLKNEFMNKGNHKIVWNGKDSNNKQVSSGIYFYKLQAGDKTLIKKMIMMK